MKSLAEKTEEILDGMIIRYPVLRACRTEIQQSFEALAQCYLNGGKVLVCGNGGSAADAEHIVAELMKGFLKKRELSSVLKNALRERDPETGNVLAVKLQNSLPAISLTFNTTLNTAFANDVDPDLVFAQQVLGYGKKGDILIGISTSGNAKNVYNALFTAKTLGLKCIGLTGQSGGKMAVLCDIIIKVPNTITPEIQELHLPIYHTLCAMLEENFFC